MIANNLISYEYVSLAISVLLMFSYRGKRKASAEIYRVYYWMVVFVMSEAIVNILIHAFITNDKGMGKSFFALLTVVYFALNVFIPFQFTVYILKMADKDLWNHKVWKGLVFVPSIIFLLLDITSPINKLIFYYDDNMTLHSGKIGFVYLIVIGYFLVLWIVITMVYNKKMENVRIFYIHAFVIMIIAIGAIGWSGYREIPTGAAYAFCLILANFGLQKSGNIYDSTNAIRFHYFYKELSNDIEEEKNISLIFIKYFDLELLMDSFGNNMVEYVMRNVNDFLGSLYDDACVYRLQKDAFVFKCIDISEEEEKKMIDEIFNRFKKPWTSLDISLMLPMSVCEIRCPDDIKSVEEIRNFVRDIKGYETESGKRYKISDIRKEKSDSKIIEAIRKAVENNTFQVFYQPIYSASEKRIVAAEALIRLIDDELGFISPEVFIPIAEENGFILKIGRFVIKEVCKFYSDNELDQKGIEYIEVNLSGVQMMQYLLAEDFCEIMDNWGLPHNRINFEITETSAMIRNAAVKMNLDYFIHNNVELSLDDFGTGYSNLSYLYNIPFSIMKIDKGILWAADKNERADKVLANTLMMANNMGMKVVVEGVETEAHVRKLLLRECDFFQGYFFSKPINGESFIEFISSFEIPPVCKILEL